MIIITDIKCCLHKNNSQTQDKNSLNVKMKNYIT